jgi:hypothetical protein
MVQFQGVGIELGPERIRVRNDETFSLTLLDDARLRRTNPDQAIA